MTLELRNIVHPEYGAPTAARSPLLEEAVPLHPTLLGWQLLVGGVCAGTVDPGHVTDAPLCY